MRDMDDHSAIAEEKEDILPWLRASLEDAKELDFEAPLFGSSFADCYGLSDLFRAAAQQALESNSQQETASSRVMTMLSSITEMHFKPREHNEPFGPLVISSDGRSTAILSDFRAHVELLAEIAVRATNPVLRARLSDVCWSLERKRRTLGLAAVTAYVDIVNKIERDELKFSRSGKGGVLKSAVSDYLRRALQIGRAIGRDEPQSISVRELVVRIQKQAMAAKAMAPTHWFCQLDLDFAVSDPIEIGDSIKSLLLQQHDDTNLQIVIELWKLAARAYHIAKREDKKNQCLSEAAEKLVAESHAKQDSPMLAACFISSAIVQLHGIPGKKERRTQLRHQLIDLQAGVPEEMFVCSYELDVNERAKNVQEVVGSADLFDMFFIFTRLTRSPDPTQLTQDAMKVLRKHPLSSVFPTSHLDREGKVIHRSEGGLGDKDDNSAILNQVAQAERIRRNFAANGKIEPARLTINHQHYLSDETFVLLLQYSPFVPHVLIETFARGFLRFFQGDFISATYILTPLLENSLRHILKSRGHDVSIFDDATQTQQNRTISSLFDQMRPELEGILTVGLGSGEDLTIGARWRWRRV